MARTTPPTTYNHDFPLVRDRDFLNLSAKRRRFVYNYYLKPFTNWSDAACYKDAYCRPDMAQYNAANLACQLKKTKRVSKVLNKLEQIQLDQMGVTAQRLILEEQAIAHSDIVDLFDEDGDLVCHPNRIPEQIRRAISGFEVTEDPISGAKKYKFKLWNKGDALKRLEAIKGIGSTKKLELSGPGGAPIETSIKHSIDISVIDTDSLQTLVRICDTYFPQHKQIEGEEEELDDMVEELDDEYDDEEELEEE